MQKPGMFPRHHTEGKTTALYRVVVSKMNFSAKELVERFSGSIYEDEEVVFDTSSSQEVFAVAQAAGALGPCVVDVYDTYNAKKVVAIEAKLNGTPFEVASSVSALLMDSRYVVMYHFINGTADGLAKVVFWACGSLSALAQIARLAGVQKFGVKMTPMDCAPH